MKSIVLLSTNSEPQLFSSEDSLAKTSQWLDNALAWLESEAGCGLSSEELLRSFDRLGLSSKMSPACYPATEGAICSSSFQGWRSSGIGGPTAFLTLNTSVWPKDASVCSLSQVLENGVAPKYFLSAKACAGILRRAAKRGKELPEPLAHALRQAAGLDQTLKQGGGLSKTLKAQSNCKHREDSETYIPVTVPTIAGVSNGGGANGPGRTADDAECLIECQRPGNGQMEQRGGPAGDEAYNLVTHSLTADGADAGELSPTLRAGVHDKSHENGGCPPAIAFTERTRADGRNFEAQEEVSYALTNPGSGGRTHSRQIATQSCVRRLTPSECERLQGFPDGWTEGFSDSVRYRMLGNAVAVPVAEWIASRIARLL